MVPADAALPDCISDACPVAFGNWKETYTIVRRKARYADRRQRHGVVPYLPLGGPCRRDADLRQRIAFDADQVMWTTSTPEVVLFIGTIVIAVALLL